MVTLSIDCMSGDHGLDSSIPAAIEVVRRNQDIHLVLVGDDTAINSFLDESGVESGLSSRLNVRHASQVVTMTDSLTDAMRKKRDSSMRVAIDLVKAGEADACVSAGNTGALMATARFVLKTIPGIDRPAICASLPRSDGNTHMLDLGANVDSPPEILYQFGIMGSVLVDCLEGKKSPTVGLLNIGVEEIKGNEVIKEAAELFKNSHLNYTGFIEADSIYIGNTDLIVCDGFVGNVALKASEGVAQMIMGAVKEEFTRSSLTKVAALVAKPVLGAIRGRLDHRKYNGASFLGLRGTVVKSHGSTDAVGFQSAIEVAIGEARSNLVSQLESTLSSSSHST